jgi:hypothetical protein
VQNRLLQLQHLLNILLLAAAAAVVDHPLQQAAAAAAVLEAIELQQVFQYLLGLDTR